MTVIDEETPHAHRPHDHPHHAPRHPGHDPPGTPDDAAEVVAMVEEIADFEDQATHIQVDLEQWRRLLTGPT